MLRYTLTLSALILPLTACTFGAPPHAQSAVHQANLAACTSQADAYQRAHDYEYLSHTQNFATPLQGMPNQHYVTNRLAEIHQRRDMIDNCMRNANPAYVGGGATQPEPRIVGPSQ